jgi:hypothetical protein
MVQGSWFKVHGSRLKVISKKLSTPCPLQRGTVKGSRSKKQ